MGEPSLAGLVLIVAGFACAHAGEAVVFPRPRTLIDSAFVHVMHQRYPTAKQMLRGRIEREPSDLDARSALLLVAQTEMLDYESYSIRGGEYIRMADTVIAMLNAQKPSSTAARARRLFHLGSAWGGVSVVLAKTDRWVQAVSPSLTSVSYLRRVLEITPSAVEAYLGIGAVDYYIGKTLSWVPYVKAKNAEGLAAIRTATRARSPYGYAAVNTLCWILLEEGQYERCDSLVMTVLRDYPDNSLFIRIRARLFMHRKRCDDAEIWARSLIDHARALNPPNWSDIMSGYQIIAQCRDRRAQANSCLAITREALSQPIPDKSRRIEYVRNHVEYLGRLAEKYAPAGR